MPPFRAHTPKRRNIVKAVNSYRDHKPDLKIDFQSRCGYCNSIDEWRIAYYEVDHFIPEDILTIKSLTDYSNLVYACRSCNNAKRKKWPTKDENIPNQNDEGFVDPCDHDYNNHFSRSDTGEIEHRTPLGKWMYYAMKLHKPQHKIIWNLERLRGMIDEIEQLNTVLNDHPAVQKLLLDTYRAFVAYTDQFGAL
jgi:uncharacterized protein (TIGR02646 family)